MAAENLKNYDYELVPKPLREHHRKRLPQNTWAENPWTKELIALKPPPNPRHKRWHKWLQTDNGGECIDFWEILFINKYLLKQLRNFPNKTSTKPPLVYCDSFEDVDVILKSYLCLHNPS